MANRTSHHSKTFLFKPRARRSFARSGKIAGLIIGLVVILLIGAVAVTQLAGLKTTTSTEGLSTYTVEKADLLVTVTEDGNLESANNIDVKCEVAGGSSILWIIPDGSEVKKGDKLVELDASAIEDQINTQKIAYNKARSAVIQAEKDYEVAKITVKEYLEGTYLKELEDAETQITIAEENLRSSKNALEYSERMFQRGYISELELESQQFSVKRAELELNSAKTAKRVLEDFTKQKTVEDLQSKVETAKAAMESEQAAFELEESKLERLETQLAHCTIVAPQSGMVVYANEQGRFGQGNVTVEEGAAVRDRQTILRLPDLNQMQVKVKVHESKVEDLQRGMRARINIQGRELQGSVTSVANQPEATSFFQGNVKEYATIVKIDGTPDGLRPGMTAEAEILVAHLKDTIVLPVATVVEQRSAYYCWVLAANGQPERRPLQLGQTNDQFVEILSGVEVGDQVIRNPRAFVQEAREQSAGGGEDEKLDVKGRFGEGTAPAPADGNASGSANGSNRPDGPGARPPGGPASPAANGEPGGGSGGRPRFDLMQMDTDGDGKISPDEAPGPMKDNFDMMDSNKDGFIDKAEADELRKRFQQGGGGRPGPPNGSASP